LLVVRVVEEDGPAETWKLSVAQVREHRLELGWCDVLSFHAEHPLLWPHVDERASLYFSSRPADPSAAIGRLWHRHHVETGGWIPFERFLNQEIALADLLGGGDGLLATGPARLLDAYGEELDAQGIRWNVVRHGPAKYWKPASEAFMAGGTWIVEDQKLQVLTLGESYVVAAHFAAAQ